MSYYFNLDRIIRQTERAVRVVPTSKDGRNGNPGEWLPKSAVGIWNHEGRLIIGIDDFYKLPPWSANWQQPGMSAGELIGMQRTAEEINLYNHVEGWRK